MAAGLARLQLRRTAVGSNTVHVYWPEQLTRIKKTRAKTYRVSGLLSRRIPHNRKSCWWKVFVDLCPGVSGFVAICCRTAYVCSKVAIALAIFVALVFGQAIHQHHHVQHAAAASNGVALSSSCSCQTCPLHAQNASDENAPDQDAPHDDHDCGVCQVLSQAADPPPAIIFGDCFIPKLEVLTVVNDDREWVRLPPRSARGPPA